MVEGHHVRQRSGSLKTAMMQHASGNGYKMPSGGEEAEHSRTSSSDTLELEEMRSDEDLTDDEETGLTSTQRKKRRKQKDKNSRLDERIASTPPNINDLAQAEKKLARSTLIKNTFINALLITLWYCFSISISVYNKWMFSKSKDPDNKTGNLDFHFPLFTTSLHMLVQFALASAVLFFVPRFRPGRDGTTATPHDEHAYSQLNDNEIDDPTKPPPPRQPLMTKLFYLTRIAPCGTATALDIGLGNFSLRFISLTFFTMCKSSVLAFVLLFAFLFQLEQPTWKLCAIIALMTAGVIMMVAGETAFNALGFVLVMTASFCSGFRWSLTQILLLRNRATSNPFSSIFFLTPVMFLALFLLALPIEGPANVVHGIQELSASHGALLSTILLLFPGTLAFMMVAAEFALLKRTSVVTLSVCGIFKEVLTISAAGAIFGDELSPINVSGLIVTILSIAGYNYLKYSKMKKEAVKEAHEIVVEERSQEIGEQRKSFGRDYDPEDEEDKDGNFALTRDSLHLGTEVGGIGQADGTNGVVK